MPTAPQPSAYWPALDTLVTELRRADQAVLAQRLLDAERAGATSGEILDSLGVALRVHRAVYGQLNDAGAQAWDAVLTEVNRTYPLARLAHGLRRFTHRMRRQLARAGFGQHRNNV